MVSFVRLGAHAHPRVLLFLIYSASLNQQVVKHRVLVIINLVWKSCERDSGNQDFRYTHFSLYGRNPLRKNCQSDENPLSETSGSTCARVLTNVLA